MNSEVRPADQQYFQSLEFDGHAINQSEVSSARSSVHPRKLEKSTPIIGLSDLQVLPEISVREWMLHTSHMLVFDWFPLTYFTVSAVLSPSDLIGCHEFGIDRSSSLLYTVYGPVLMLRFLGMLFFNRPRYIIYQIAAIYGYLVISLTVWDYNTFAGMKELDRACFKPLHMSSLNVMLMALYYLFVLCPFYTIAAVLPYYFYQVCKYVGREKKRVLMKHYLVKAMPSIVFNKNMF